MRGAAAAPDGALCAVLWAQKAGTGRTRAVRARGVAGGEERPAWGRGRARAAEEVQAAREDETVERRGRPLQLCPHVGD